MALLLCMIKSFKSKETEKIWKGVISTKLPTEIQNIIMRKLRMINNSESLSDLRIPPANHLEALKGDRKGQYSIKINDKWRICFKWNNGDCYDLEVVDYH